MGHVSDSQIAYAKWQGRARNLLKGELKKAGITYARLAELLLGEGLRETEKSIRGKLSRGSFSAGFFLAALRVIDAKNVRIEDL